MAASSSFTTYLATLCLLATVTQSLSDPRQRLRNALFNIRFTRRQSPSSLVSKNFVGKRLPVRQDTPPSPDDLDDFLGPGVMYTDDDDVIDVDDDVIMRELMRDKLLSSRQGSVGEIGGGGEFLNTIRGDSGDDDDVFADGGVFENSDSNGYLGGESGDDEEEETPRSELAKLVRLREHGKKRQSFSHSFIGKRSTRDILSSKYLHNQQDTSSPVKRSAEVDHGLLSLNSNTNKISERDPGYSPAYVAKRASGGDTGLTAKRSRMVPRFSHSFVGKRANELKGMLEAKRFRVYPRFSHSFIGKRAPGFNHAFIGKRVRVYPRFSHSFVGKRAPGYSETFSDLKRSRLVPRFSHSFVGKRSVSDLPDSDVSELDKLKRGFTHSFIGKRGYVTGPMNVDAGSLTDKRFSHSFVGKRMIGSGGNNFNEKRFSHSFVGKRIIGPDDKRFSHSFVGKRMVGPEEKRFSHSFVGKRMIGPEEKRFSHSFVGKRMIGPEEKRFSHSFVGKRMIGPEEKRFSHSFVGKRQFEDYEFSGDINKADDKRIFQPNPNGDYVNGLGLSSEYVGDLENPLESKRFSHSFIGKRIPTYDTFFVKDHIQPGQQFSSDKRFSHSFVGKRGYNHAFVGKRGYNHAFVGKRAQNHVLEKRSSSARPTTETSFQDNHQHTTVEPEVQTTADKHVDTQTNNRHPHSLHADATTDSIVVSVSTNSEKNNAPLHSKNAPEKTEKVEKSKHREKKEELAIKS